MATKTTSKLPTHYLYAVTQLQGSDKGFWTRIGAAWPNGDGKGFNFKLDLLPLNGADIVMREPKEERRCEMKLLTKAQRAKLLDNGRRQAAVKGTDDELDLWPVVKLFNPCGAATWLLIEIDPDDETVAWGLCDLGMGFPEFGTVSLTEMAEYRGRLGLGIERDLHFKAQGPISAYIEAANKAERIVENIS